MTHSKCWAAMCGSPVSSNPIAKGESVYLSF
jgi:hypothetical protein